MECFICKKSLNSIDEALEHLKKELTIKEGQKNFRLQCLFKQNGCDTNFTSFFSLKRHLESSHIKYSTTPKRKIDTGLTPRETFLHTSIEDVRSVVEELFINMEIMGIPDVQQDELADVLLQLVTTISSLFKCTVKSNDDQKLVNESIEAISSLISDSVDDFQSKYLRHKYFQKLPTYVAPIEKSIAPRIEKINDKDNGIQLEKLVQSTFQYVPILNTLKMLFSLPEFRNIYFNNAHSCEDGVFDNVCCGKNCKKGSFFKENPNAVLIELYYDETDAVDGLKSKAGVHKLAQFYFRIKNLPTNCQSQWSNIHLLATCYYEDVKRGK